MSKDQNTPENDDLADLIHWSTTFSPFLSALNSALKKGEEMVVEDCPCSRCEAEMIADYESETEAENAWLHHAENDEESE